MNLQDLIENEFNKYPTSSDGTKDILIESLKEIINNYGRKVYETNLLKLLYRERAQEKSVTYIKRYTELITLIESKNFVTGVFDQKNTLTSKRETSILAEDTLKHRPPPPPQRNFYYLTIKRFLPATLIISCIVLLYSMDKKILSFDHQPLNNTEPEKSSKNNLEPFSKEIQKIAESGQLGDLAKGITEVGKVLVEDEDGNLVRKRLTADEIKKLNQKKKSAKPHFFKDQTFSEAYPYPEKAIEEHTSPKEAEKSDFDEKNIRYIIKFHPYRGLKLRMLTKISKTVYGKSGRVKEKVNVSVHHTEEIVSLFGDSFETKKAVITKSDNLENLNYFKFFNIGEAAYAMYTMEGLLKDYRYVGSSRQIWYPYSYNDFMYPRHMVGLNIKWSDLPVPDSNEGIFTYEIVGFRKYKNFDVMRVRMDSLPKYRSHVNDNPSRMVPGKAKGIYYLDIKTGAIVYYSLKKVYSYKISDRDGESTVSFEYDTKTY